MNIQEFNKSEKGRKLMAKINALHMEIQVVIDEASREIAKENEHTFIDYDDSGFFENPDI